VSHCATKACVSIIYASHACSQVQVLLLQIEDTNDFIKMHLNSTRNKTLRMALFMEMGTLSVGTGALCSGIFGMNLLNSIETHPSAFYSATGGILVLVGGLFGIFSRRFITLNKDFRSAKSYQALKHFLTYVEGVESTLRQRSLDRKEFRSILEPVVGTQLTEEEVEAVFSALDADRDGSLDLSELTAAGASSTSTNSSCIGSTKGDRDRKS